MNKFDNILDDSGSDMVAGPQSPTLKKPPMPRRQQTALAQIDAALVNKDGVMTYKGITLSGAGVEFNESATASDLHEVMQILIRLQDRVQFLIADALAQYERAGWGEATAYAEALGISSRSLSNSISALRGVSLSLRREVLAKYDLNEFEPTLSHYKIIQALDEDDQRTYLHKLMREKLSKRKLNELVHGKAETERRTNYEILTDRRVEIKQKWSGLSKKEKEKQLAAWRKLLDELEADL